MEPDYDGWFTKSYDVGGRFMTLEHRKESRFGRLPMFSMFYNGDMITCAHPEALALVTGIMENHSPLQPLIDWLMENVALTGKWVYHFDCWVYANQWTQTQNMHTLEALAKALLTEQVQP